MAANWKNLGFNTNPLCNWTNLDYFSLTVRTKRIKHMLWIIILFFTITDQLLVKRKSTALYRPLKDFSYCTSSIAVELTSPQQLFNRVRGSLGTEVVFDRCSAELLGSVGVGYRFHRQLNSQKDIHCTLYDEQSSSMQLSVILDIHDC